MKVHVAHLAEYLDSPPPVEQLVERLTMGGLEVDGVHTMPAIDGVVVGRVTAVEAHPDAEKLQVCRVDVGDGEPVQVVCGAANVHVGMTAPFATVGARLGDLQIKRAKLRGVESHGMLCSASELGIADTSKGLLALDDAPGAPDAPDACTPGAPIDDYLQLAGSVLDIDLTPNRPDCFSVRGIARELAALDGVSLSAGAPPKLKAKAFKTKAMGNAIDFAIDVREPEACPRYLARVIKNIPQNATTPLWVRERLWSGGMQPVHPVVDALNMWMLEIGQPMHAFDLDKLAGALVVRRARAGEQMTAIGGEALTLPEDCLVIADDEGAVAVAGIIGGARAEVTESTRNVLLECAFFSPRAVAGRARALRKHTEASLRFERGVDPQLQAEALDRATETIATIAQSASNAGDANDETSAVEIGKIISACDEACLPQAKPIRVAREDIERALGVEVDMSALKASLKASGCKVKGGRATLECTPPSWRFDLEVPADVIEEAGRFHGYDRIPETPDTYAPADARPAGRTSADRWSDALRAQGYYEAITMSFGAPEAMAVFSDDAPLVLENPIAPELAAMRTSLWPGLIDALRYNLNRGRDAVRLFECGRVFAQSGDRETVIAGLAFGLTAPEQWGAASRQCDFYDVKGDLESLFNLFHTPPVFESATRKGLHPGQTARIVLDGNEVGCIGALSPSEEKSLDVPSGVFLFELRVDTAIASKAVKCERISKYPIVRNDISITVPESTPVGDLIEHIRSLGIEDLQTVMVFDVFQGENIGSDEKSVSLYLIYQKFYSTLSGEEAAKYTQAVLDSLIKAFHARPRQEDLDQGGNR